MPLGKADTKYDRSDLLARATFPFPGSRTSKVYCRGIFTSYQSYAIRVKDVELLLPIPIPMDGLTDSAPETGARFTVTDISDITLHAIHPIGVARRVNV